jgi:hypothetical protein
LKRFLFLSLSLLLALISGCITFKLPPPPAITLPAITPPTVPVPAPVPFSVTGITAGTEPSNAPGACPFMLYANITASGPGTATYIWESMDGGGYSYTWSITFPSAGTQKINLPPEMSALPSGSYRVHTLTPNDAVSNPTYYTSCRP